MTLQLDIDRFLADYWQQRPCLIRQALPAFTDPVTPEELAGLACEDDVEARIVLENGGERPWEVRYSPFDTTDFSTLPETHWTFLVQDADKYVPELTALLDTFQFIPAWRLDDVMVSYAATAGSVGPHVDAYDVFLLQGMGRRCWHINQHKLPTDAWIPDLDLRILRTFQAEQSWVLEPGDLLYLPPGVAHHGIALEPCMTYSIGFRAPAAHELGQAFLEDQLGASAEAVYYVDPKSPRAQQPGLIPAAALTQLRALLLAQLDLSEAGIHRWLGRYLSTPKEALASQIEPGAPLAPSAFWKRWRRTGSLQRNVLCRFLYTEGPQAVTLFVNGEVYTLRGATSRLAAELCALRELPHARFAGYQSDTVAGALLHELYQAGYLQFPDTQP